MKKIVAIACALLMIQGCFMDDFFDDFEQPVVLNVSPVHNSTSVSADAVITVDFSKEMDTVRTNNGFYLSSSVSGRIDGYYLWENRNRRLTFTPAEPLVLAEAYTVRITDDVEDLKGNDLRDEFVSVFYVNDDFSLPFVESFSPQANSIGNPPDTDVVIRFSEPVDMNTVYDGISITPSVEGYHEAGPDGKTVRYRTLYGFSYGVTYTVTVDRSVLNTGGNRLLKEVVFNFTVGDDFERPTLMIFQDNPEPLFFDDNFITRDAEKDGSLVIDFSKEVKTGDLLNAVNISPSVPFFISTSNIEEEDDNSFTRAVINFTENLQSEENYTLNVSSTVTDLQDNRLDRDYRFRFITDGPGSIAPYVTAIGEAGGEDWSRDEVEWFTIELDLLSKTVRVDFSAQIDPSSLRLSADRVAGSEGGMPYISDINWSNDLTQLTFRLGGVMDGSVYKILIQGEKGGLKDLNDNYMKEDFIQMVRF